MSCCPPKEDTAQQATRESVQEYYGKILSKSDDLKTNACTTDSGLPPQVKAIFPLLSDEVITRYYGCGIVIPELLEGCSVLDLGCGAGRDCYIISKLVGERGRVVGVDMTDEQLEVANRNIDHHTRSFGFARANVEFKKGYIERLNELNLADNSFDVIVSNCVINLSPDKDAVLREAFRVLKPGGELYFSDVYSDRRIPQDLVDDPVLFGECLSGALYWNDFLTLARRHGFADPRLVSDSRITIENAAIEKKVGHIKFFSATYRLFKHADLESDCEDYGEAVIYKGTVPTSPQAFTLDAHHTIQAGRVFPVCRNTLRMLTGTRFAPHFDVVGAGKQHYGLFEGCGKAIPFASASDSAAAAGGGSGGGCC
eukprot:TRINITY_DN4461_c0_g1_i3.p1 TRINITY_DN4461_c0_g1~~TRINITY_DN4461_c0_g1_i3.p1  ORF type:complete len:429 (-),score=110.52 TRINITY_DN4461_c0_g1_i3:268-1374(-)